MAATSAAPASSQSAGDRAGLIRLFYPGMALIALAIVALGFAPTFYLRPSSQPPLQPRVVFHGMLFSAWVLVFLAQTTLVERRRIDIHQRLGWLGLALAVSLIVVGPFIALPAARDGRLPGDPLAFLLVPLTDILLFATCFALAFTQRRHPETHKRWMLLATLSLLPPAISRIPIAANRPPVILGFMLILVAARPVVDWLTERRLHPVSLWGGLALAVSFPARFALSETAAWHRIAEWLVGR